MYPIPYCLKFLSCTKKSVRGGGSGHSRLAVCHGQRGPQLSSRPLSSDQWRTIPAVIDTAPGNAAEHAERMTVGVEQHLVGLRRVSPHQERPAVRQFDMGNLLFDLLATNVGPALAPIERERFARLKHQRHVGASPCCLFRTVPFCAPRAGESCNPPARSIISDASAIAETVIR